MHEKTISKNISTKHLLSLNKNFYYFVYCDILVQNVEFQKIKSSKVIYNL